MVMDFADFVDFVDLMDLVDLVDFAFDLEFPLPGSMK